MKTVFKLTLGVFIVLHVPLACRGIEVLVSARSSASFSSFEAARVLEELCEEYRRTMETT